MRKDLVFEWNDGAPIAAESSHLLEVTIGARDGHHRSVAVNGMTGGSEEPASALGMPGDLGGGLAQGFLRAPGSDRQTERQG